MIGLPIPPLPPADFRYVDDPHGYWLGVEELPSPSKVFLDLGLVNPKYFKPEDRARGRAVHAGLHYGVKGTLDWETLDPELHGYVHSGLKLVDRLKPTIRRYETPLCHPLLRFAGTSDLEWDLDGWPWIIDWKSGKAPKVTAYQTAAYEALARYARGPYHNLPFKRAAVELQADGSIANLVRYEDHTDGAGWLNLLGAYRIRQALRAPQIEYQPQGE